MDKDWLLRILLVALFCIVFGFPVGASLVLIACLSLVAHIDWQLERARLRSIAHLESAKTDLESAKAAHEEDSLY